MNWKIGESDAKQISYFNNPFPGFGLQANYGHQLKGSFQWVSGIHYFRSGGRDVLTNNQTQDQTVISAYLDQLQVTSQLRRQSKLNANWNLSYGIGLGMGYITYMNNEFDTLKQKGDIQNLQASYFGNLGIQRKIGTQGIGFHLEYYGQFQPIAKWPSVDQVRIAGSVKISSLSASVRWTIPLFAQN
ncbi:MAG: hypothetical protein EP332_01700 [Bacteroidetes bacterium]|nr:MAG: hypothetical protein EP332_01700 [Bacteroidota bacterium]